MVTINDVANAAKVSKATVSRYLNDRSLVREETANIIGRVIADLNYIPSASARNLVLKQSNKIGALVSGVCSPFWNRVMESFHEYISRRSEGYEILSLNCDSNILYNTNKSVLDKIHVMAEQRVAGMVLALRDLREPEIDYLCSTDIPFVVVQGNAVDNRISCVNIDNFKASYDAAQHLLRLGHKQIAYVAGPRDALYSNARFQGYQEAMQASRLYHRGMVLSGNNLQPDGYWRTKQILSWDALPSAIIFASDAMAYGAMRAISEAGLRIPDDISLIGFDDLQNQVDLFNMLPPLTTVRQPLSEIGENTAELLLKKIREKELGKNNVYRVMLPTSFIDMGSCRAI